MLTSWKDKELRKLCLFFLLYFNNIVSKNQVDLFADYSL